MPCPNPLLFDVEVGSCVRSEQLSASAKAGRPPGIRTTYCSRVVFLWVSIIIVLDNQKTWEIMKESAQTQILDRGLGSWIRDPGSEFPDPRSRIRKKLYLDPNPGVRKAPEPGSGIRIRTLLVNIRTFPPTRGIFSQIWFFQFPSA